MKNYAIKVTLQAGEKQFNFTKLFASESVRTNEVSREFLEEYYDEPEFENDFCAFYDCGSYAITVNSVEELSEMGYSIAKTLI